MNYFYAISLYIEILKELKRAIYIKSINLNSSKYEKIGVLR